MTTAYPEKEIDNLRPELLKVLIDNYGMDDVHYSASYPWRMVKIHSIA